MLTNARAQAAHILKQVFEGRTLTHALEHLTHPEKPFIQALCYGVCRDYESLDFLLNQLLQKPLPPAQADIKALCLLGIYQLLDDNTAEHAAIFETVQAVEALKQQPFKSLVNAICRNFQRNQTSLLQKLQSNDARFNMPLWLLKKIKHAYPNQWEAICMASHQKPPMTVRVNLSKQTREDFLTRVAGQAGVADSAVILDTPQSVETLPGFDEGLVSVQDEASQRIPAMLTLKPGMRVLDACSAPGSKLAHLLECCPELQCTAIEIDAQRVEKLKQTLSRQGVEPLVIASDVVAKQSPKDCHGPAGLAMTKQQVSIICADASDVETWWDNQPFDIILIDAPCSATGVIRRHPDIKLMRRETDIKPLVATQKKLLKALWPLLAPGGQLLYTTCSILPEENQQVMQSFCDSQGMERIPGLQILPGEDNCDGFYFARLQT